MGPQAPGGARPPPAQAAAPEREAGAAAAGAAAQEAPAGGGQPRRGEPGPDRRVAPPGGAEGSRQPGAPAAVGGAQAAGQEAPMSNYAFFVKYTYSNECALLAYNFHELVTKLKIFDHFEYRHDHRLISVTLAYIFYRYQVHHCDMALDLAVTLVYLEEAAADARDPACGAALREQSKDAFNLICYLAFLAHAFNADRTIRLSDWYKEIGWRSFPNCDKLNGYVFFLFSQVRRFRLRVSESRVKRYIQKLCSVPSQAHAQG